jgi:two-component system sensor histidine kinase RpfC
MDDTAIGLPSDIVRSRFVTTLTVPLDPLALAASLKIARAVDAAARPDRERAGPIVAASRSLSILVADDNRTNQKVVAKILERAGHRAVIAEDGEAALDMLNADEFDLVLMDVNMPIMNGIEATKLYRFASLGRAHVPIVALTADATKEVARRCEDAGMDACVTKPIEPHRLLALIDSLTPDRKKPQLASSTIVTADQIRRPSRNRNMTAPSVDFTTLDALEALGGKEFVDEITTQFLIDTTDILRSLAAVVASGDVLAFREQLHALRSAAANVGARCIYEMCLDWRLISAGDLASRGEAHLKRLHKEFARVCGVLQARLSGREAAA